MTTKEMRNLHIYGILVCFVTSAVGQNFYFYNEKEGNHVTFNCDREKDSSSNPGDPYIIIDEVKYTFDGCQHTDVYGIKDRCDNETSCSFDITNANVGSSCGYGDFKAGLHIKYHCVRHGGWSPWSQWGGCSQGCWGGYQTRTRNCNNPSPNYFSNNEYCMNDRDYESRRCTNEKCPWERPSDCSLNNQAFHWERPSDCSLNNQAFHCKYDCNEYCMNDSDYQSLHCNTETCYYSNFACRDSTIQLPCNDNNLNGKLYITSATWRTSTTSCFGNYGVYRSHDVRSKIGDECDKGYTCSVTVDDSLRYCPYCSTLDYTYSCEYPQWQQWGSWDDCTVSCGRGTQTRTRVCDTVTNTDRGDLQCEDEHHTEEKRECLLAGTVPYCTYCMVETFSYGNAVNIARSTDINEGNVVLLESDIDIVRCCGRIQSYTFYPVNTGTLKIVVFRPSENPEYRTVVAVNTVEITGGDLNALKTVSIPESDRMTIIAGDRIGWYDGGNNIIAYGTCDSQLNFEVSSTSFDYSTNYCPTNTSKMEINNPTVGDSFKWTSGTQYTRFYAFEYQTTTNTPPTFTMSTYIVSIQDHTSIDTSVIDMYFTDPDYADWFVDYQPDYGHSYFYYDTQTKTVHVKSNLPHDGVNHEHVHTYVLSAEDSCYNRVTGTVTITTYNDPPFFTDLPKTETVDEIETGNIVSFTVVDAQNDPISCVVSSTVPPTSGSLFDINGRNVALVSGATLNKDVSSAYLVYIDCSDGTDTGYSNLTIEVRRNITEEGQHEHYYYFNQTEDKEAILNCSSEIIPYYTYTDFVVPADPYIVIDEVIYTYFDYICEHTDKYGVQDMCENKTDCIFNITGANIMSACGNGDRIAGLFVRYHCVRDGAWTTWSEWGECSRSCAGGYKRRERNCTNPEANYFSKNEACEDSLYYEEERCNTQDCTYSGTTCRDDTVQPVCNSYNTNGYITMIGSTYQFGCAWSYNTRNLSHDVTVKMKEHCDNHNVCPVLVSDGNMGQACSSDLTVTKTFSYVSQYWCEQKGWFSCHQTVSDSFRQQNVEYCGKLYWDYACTVPQWTLWGSWSSCSVGCGIGTQTRSRTCENELETRDGVLRTCAQTGSELQRSETRSCLTRGRHQYCTYCGTNWYYPFTEISAMSNYINDTLDGNAILLESDYDIVRCCGLIQKWTFRPTNTGTIIFIVWRPTTESGNDFKRKVVGVTSYQVIASDVGQITTHTPPTTERIAVTANDIIGWYDNGSNIIAYDTCDSTFSGSTPDHQDFSRNYCPTRTLKMTLNEKPKVDLVENWNTTVIRNRVYALQYQTTPNNAPAFPFSGTTYERPEWHKADRYVGDFYFTDSDYGDFYKDYQQDYDDPYFYLDTRLGQIRVKNDLFHERGVRSHRYSFTVSAEDSCYNKVTGTVTIVTYNVAPVFNNLDASVNISEFQTNGEVYTLDMYDPDNDTFTWHIIGSTPTTDIFYLNDTKIMLVNGTILDKTELDYTLRIVTDDTAHTRTGALTVNVIVTPVLQPLYYTHNATEGDVASLTGCNSEIQPVDSYSDYKPPLDVYIVIDNVTYQLPSFFQCLHNLTYGVKDMCDNKTTCTFDVTNANVASSCGTQGNAALWVRYHCVRDSGWTTWNNWHDCTRTCGGGYRVRYRTCTNPSRNYFGSDRDCEDSIDEEWERCNTQFCYFTGQTCRNDYYEPRCYHYLTNGTISRMPWNYFREGCAWDYNTIDPGHVIYNPVTDYCLNHFDCSVLVSDNLKDCYTDEYQTVNETYMSYERSAWGWLSYPVTKWRYYTTRVISICGVLRWQHECNIPQWTQWSQWTPCSLTCDRGVQTRTRMCQADTESDTVDGYINRCGQLYDETHTLESRECLLLGNHRYCTYCEDRTFIYGNTTTHTADNDTDVGNGVILKNEIDIVRCCGLIAYWEFYVMNPGTLKFVVWRSIGVEGFYEVVGTNSVNISASDVNQLYKFTPDQSDRIAIIAEDLIGWYDDGANIIGHDNCSSAYNASTRDHRDLRPNYCPTKTYKLNLDKEPDDKDVYNLTKFGTRYIDRVYVMQYTTTANTPPYFKMPRYDKTIPDHSEIDFSLIDFYFNDTDYADWFVDYQPEYDNDSYFYFDTFAKSIHVKDRINHTVGIQNHYHKFIIWAEDSCYNRITGTVTITTFNGPPVFTDLPKKVMVSEAKTGALASFTVTDPSYGPDTIVCVLNRTIPESEGHKFYLQGITVYLSDLATLDRDENDLYEIKIHCNDGTDTTENYMTLEVTKELNDSEAPPEWIEIETYTIAAVVTVAVIANVAVVYMVIMNGLMPVV